MSRCEADRIILQRDGARRNHFGDFTFTLASGKRYHVFVASPNGVDYGVSVYQGQRDRFS